MLRRLPWGRSLSLRARSYDKGLCAIGLRACRPREARRVPLQELYATTSGAYMSAACLTACCGFAWKRVPISRSHECERCTQSACATWTPCDNTASLPTSYERRIPGYWFCVVCNSPVLHD